MLWPRGFLRRGRHIMQVNDQYKSQTNIYIYIFGGCARCGQRLQQLGLYRRSDNPLVGPISTSCIIIYMYIFVPLLLIFFISRSSLGPRAMPSERSVHGFLAGPGSATEAGNASIHGGMQLGSCPEIMGTWSFYVGYLRLAARPKSTRIDPDVVCWALNVHDA